MGETLRENGVPRSATKQGAPWRAEAAQAELFGPSLPSWRSWIRWLIKGDYKPLGLRCFGGDPEQARLAMLKVLESKQGRRFDIDWLDHLAEIGGPDAQEAIARFVCERYGFQPPIRKPDPQREEERIADLQVQVATALEVFKNVGSELAAMRKDREGRR